jgi:hypothetical protein
MQPRRPRLHARNCIKQRNNQTPGIPEPLATLQQISTLGYLLFLRTRQNELSPNQVNIRVKTIAAQTRPVVALPA